MTTALTPTDFPWYDYRSYTFSLGLSLDGQSALLSGHTASEFDPDLGKATVKGTLAEQVRTAYAKIEAILGADGFTLADVSRVVEYVKVDALDDYPEIAAVRDEILAEARPVVNTVCVRQLLRTRALLEVEVVARKPEGGDVLDGVVYLPSITAAAGGTLADQMAGALDEAERRLKVLGLGLDAVTKIVEYPLASSADDLAALDEARHARLGAARPASTRVPVDRLRGDGSLVQIDVTASHHPSRTVGPAWPLLEQRAASPGVVAGRILYLSGQGGVDRSTSEPLRSDDVVGQAEDAFAALGEVLESAGLGLDALVKTIEYTAVESLPSYRGVAGVRSRLLSEPYPASTGLVVPRLAVPGQLIEVDSLALLPAGG